jgi:hypothetical protein
MKRNFYIILFFIILGFIFSFFPSIFAQVSFLKLLLRVFLSIFMMGLFGYIFYFFIEKNVSIDEINGNVAINIGKKKEDKKEELNNFEDYFKENIKSELYEENISDLKQNEENNEISESSYQKEENSNDEINYSSIFSALENENQDNKEDENNFESFDRANKSEEKASNKKEIFISENNISNLENEVFENKNNLSNDSLFNSKILHNDREIKEANIEESDKTIISATSSSAIVNSDIESIDKDYIYLKNKKKIENKPDKLAKVIKNMLYEDKNEK